MKKGVSDDFLDTSCDKCLPSLWTKPSTLTLDKVTTTATVQEYEGVVNQGGMNVEVPINTVTTASLTLASPCSLEWKDLQDLNTVTGPNAFSADAGLQSFTLTGGEWVSHQSGSFETPNQGSCPTYTDYSIDVFVDATNLASHGVQELQGRLLEDRVPALTPQTVVLRVVEVLLKPQTGVLRVVEVLLKP